MSAPESTPAIIKLSQILPPTHVLRPVKVKEAGYIGIVESIRVQGIEQSLLVCPAMSPDGSLQLTNEAGELLYYLVDGNHRYTAAKELKLETVPVLITRPLTPNEIIEKQINANLHNVQTKPAEFARAITNQLANDPLLTKVKIALKHGQSTSWVDDVLKLPSLPQEVQDMVDKGEVPLTNAYELTRLGTPEEVMDMIDDARTMKTTEFISKVKTYINNKKKDVANAKKDSGFEPTPGNRKVSELREVTPEIAASMCEMTNAKSSVEGFLAGVAYCIKLDPISVANAKKEYDNKIAQQEAKAKEKEIKKASGDVEKANEKSRRAQRFMYWIEQGLDREAANKKVAEELGTGSETAAPSTPSAAE